MAGQLWDATPSDQAEVSVEQFISEQFKINLGDTIRFDVLGRVIAARVTSIRLVEWADSRAGGFMFVFRPGVLEKAPHSFVGFLRGPQDAAAREPPAGGAGRRGAQRVGDRRPRDPRAPSSRSSTTSRWR